MVEQGERRSAGLRQGGEVGPRVELRYDGHEKRLEFLEFSYTRARHKSNPQSDAGTPAGHSR